MRPWSATGSTSFPYDPDRSEQGVLRIAALCRNGRQEASYSPPTLENGHRLTSPLDFIEDGQAFCLELAGPNRSHVTTLRAHFGLVNGDVRGSARS